MQNENVLGGQCYVNIENFPVFGRPDGNALCVSFKGGIMDNNVILEWHLYNISPDGDINIAFGDEPTGTDIASFLTNVDSRFQIIASRKGFTIQ